MAMLLEGDMLDAVLRLVKDLSVSGIVYFWIDNDSMKVSPDIPTLLLAEEWRTGFLFADFDGVEKRQSQIDRRKDKHQRIDVDEQLLSDRSHPEGRRLADLPVKVDIDLAAEKLKVYYS